MTSLIETTSIPLLLGWALILGIRHGIDWDHIAAVADITAAQTRIRGGLYLGSMYAAGHATVVFALGLLAVVVGMQLPVAVDTILEPVVGVTLIVLGMYVLVALWRFGINARLQSRWLLLLDGLHTAGHHLAAWTLRRSVEPRHRAIESYGPRTAFGVGLLHGIGAETPTQAVLLTTAAGLGGGTLGLGMLGVFVVGTIVSTVGIVFVSLAGYVGAAKHPRLTMALSFVTAASSIAIGVTFVLGRSSTLPALVGG